MNLIPLFICPLKHLNLRKSKSNLNTFLGSVFFLLEYAKGLRIFVLRLRNSESYNDVPQMAHYGGKCYAIGSALRSRRRSWVLTH
jgi:hypothetical protein